MKEDNDFAYMLIWKRVLCQTFDWNKSFAVVFGRLSYQKYATSSSSLNEPIVHSLPLCACNVASWLLQFLTMQSLPTEPYRICYEVFSLRGRLLCFLCCNIEIIILSMKCSICAHISPNDQYILDGKIIKNIFLFFFSFFQKNTSWQWRNVI